MIALTCDLAETDESRCAAKERDCDCYIAVVGPFCWVSCVVVGSWGLAPSLQTHYLRFGMYYHWTLLNLYYKTIVRASQRVIGRTLPIPQASLFRATYAFRITFVSATSPKRIDRGSLGRSRTGTRQGRKMSMFKMVVKKSGVLSS